jgi:signal transduction histidine kinase
LTQIDVSLVIEGDFGGVPAATSLCLYRITQEALRNVARHAKVAAATVKLRHAGALLTLTVSDSGAGMAPGSANAHAGLGLVSIRERTRLARGKLEITSALNQGTTIAVSIPD